MGNLVIEQNSRFGFDQTVELLLAEAEKANWNNPATHDLKQSIAKSGKIVKPVKVIELCKPAYSGKMLELNDERIISVMMPCRISVYEKDDGRTYVALINVEKLAEDLPANIAAVMKEASDEINSLVSKVTG
jgi:uncharacterized protein (DUF302 family)